MGIKKNSRHEKDFIKINTNSLIKGLVSVPDPFNISCEIQDSLVRYKKGLIEFDERG